MNTRDWATAIWLAAFVAFVFISKDARPSVLSALRQLTSAKILIPLLLYVGLVAGLAYGVDWLGYWSSSLIGATVFWFLFTGFKYFMQINETGKEGFFRERLLEVIGLAAFFEFFMNVETFSLWIELAIIPAMATLVGMQVVSKTDEKLASARKLMSFLIGIGANRFRRAVWCCVLDGL